MSTPIKNTELIPAISQSLELPVPTHLSYEELHALLADYFSGLINSNFEKLVFLLYRIDVDENRMRVALDKRTGTDAAALIAELVIERQDEKIKSRQEHRRDNNIREDEAW